MKRQAWVQYENNFSHRTFLKKHCDSSWPGPISEVKKMTWVSLEEIQWKLSLIFFREAWGLSYSSIIVFVFFLLSIQVIFIKSTAGIFSQGSTWKAEPPEKRKRDRNRGRIKNCFKRLWMLSRRVQSLYSYSK